MSIQEIDVDTLADRLAAGARLFDVREPAEFEQARVPGGVLIPLGEVLARVEEFRGEGTAYVICRSGARSMTACQALAQRGIVAVNVAGGTLAWVDSGRDVLSGPA